MANVLLNRLNLVFPSIYVQLTRRELVRHVSATAASRPKSFQVVEASKSHPIKFAPSIRRHVTEKIKQSKSDDDGKWSVIAYNLSEELKIENVHNLIDNLGDYLVSPLPNDVQEGAVMLSAKSQQLSSHETDRKPLNDIILFREGSVVFWGVPYDQQKRVLYGLASLKINPNTREAVQEEKEHISYSLTNQGEKSRLIGDMINIVMQRDSNSQLMDQFAFSHAVALSVKLGIWEVMLDEYIDSVEWITENMKRGKDIKLTKDQVFRKTGEILCLKHSINLSSDLLDLPDIYWDRVDQEAMFSSLFSYLMIRKRTNVINDKLNHCCDLMNLLASHMNDRHHIRLEWMIIVLITVEVLFEFVRFSGLIER